jgi:protein arginine kinase
MNFDQLLKRPTAWQTRDHSTGIVVSSRVRLARNLPDIPFPGWADDAARVKAWNRIEPVVTALPSLPDCFSCGLGDLTKLDRQMLFERNVISREHAERNEGGGIVVAPDAGVSIMVNEEDHLRIQAFDAGLRLQECLVKADRVDTEIEARLDYAFSPKLGYLTACPSNVGTGNARQRHAARAGPRANGGDLRRGARPRQDRPGRARPGRRRLRGHRQSLPGVQPDHPGRGRVRGGRQLPQDHP